MSSLGSQGSPQYLPPHYPLPKVNPKWTKNDYRDWSLSWNQHAKFVGGVSAFTAFLHGFIMHFDKILPYLHVRKEDNIYNKSLSQGIMEVKWLTRSQSIAVQTAELSIVLSSITWFNYRCDNRFSGFLAGSASGVGISMILAPYSYYSDIIRMDASLTTFRQRCGAFVRTFRPEPRYAAFFTLSNVLFYGITCGLYNIFKYDLQLMDRWWWFTLGVWCIAVPAAALQYSTMQLFTVTRFINARLVELKAKPLSERTVLRERYRKKGRLSAIATGFYNTRPGLRCTAIAVAISVYDIL